MIGLRLDVDLTLGDGGRLTVALDVDWSTLTAADRQLVEALLDAVGHHELAAGDTPARTPNQGGTDDCPYADGITPPLHDSPEERRADRVGAAATADDVADAGPEAPPAAAEAEPPLRAAAGTREWEVFRGRLTGRDRIVAALREAGGVVSDERGGAAAMLLDLAGVSHGTGRVLLQQLDADGVIVRDSRGNARRTYVIALVDQNVDAASSTDKPDVDVELTAVVDPPPSPPSNEPWTEAPIERRPFDPDAARMAAAAAI